MKLGIKTCTLTLPYEEALDFCVQLVGCPAHRP